MNLEGSKVLVLGILTQLARGRALGVGAYSKALAKRRSEVVVRDAHGIPKSYSTALARCAARGGAR